ncbi:ABC transporter permease [Frondihabitans sucicola]|uniref:ABC transporter permease n=1 Tax=Frondihabitans sucicola TaxID=1268041 RepID=A0ABM8GUA5_9MICO|nr:ABC transporter permease [Frondihabitans sucicola]BDZ52040.1 ABC transporter permease [Frondihabitans sucicola]
MIVYVLRRLGAGVVVFLSVTALTYALFHARGGDALARHFLPVNASAEQVHRTAGSLGLLRPLHVQYLEWLGDLLHGSLGFSFDSDQSVLGILANRLPVTLSLVVMSLIITIVIGVPLGVLAATRGGVLDRGLQVLTVVVQAVPGYWLALILAIVFGLVLRLVPATGYVPLSVSPTGWFSTMILPALAIALGAVAFVAAQIRGTMLDVLQQDYIRTIRSRGISSRSIVLKHALRNAAPPMLTVLSLQVISLLGGAVIVERIFALPGLGSISVSAGQQGDAPVVLGTVMYMVIVVVVVNLATDVLNGFLNPKVRIR